MKTAIDWILLALGAVLMATGAWWMWTGWDLVQIERGWASLIAGAVMLSGGLVTVAVAWVVIRLRPAQPARTAVAAAEVTDDRIPVSADAGRDHAPDFAPDHAPNPAREHAAGIGAAAIAGVAAASAGAIAIAAADREPADSPEAPAVESPPVQAKRPSVLDLLHPETADAHKVESAVKGPDEAEEFPDLLARPRENVPVVLDDATDDLAWEFPPRAEHDASWRRDDPQPAPVIEDALEPPPLAQQEEFELAPAASDSHQALVHDAQAQPAAVQEDDPDWLEETARSLDRELGRSALSRETVHEEDNPPPAPAPEPAVIGRYASGDTNYVMFADGSIEAQTPDGAMRFASLVELRRFVEERG